MTDNLSHNIREKRGVDCITGGSGGTRRLIDRPTFCRPKLAIIRKEYNAF